jgi:hypothetical protein
MPDDFSETVIALYRLLMFNTRPAHGEAESTFTFEGERLYRASLAPEEYRVLLARGNFEVVRHVANDSQSGGRTAWLCRRNRNR